MSYCPLISYQRQNTSKMDCIGEDCVFWSYNKDRCLIRLALLKYSQNISREISKEDELEAKIDILQKQVQAVSMGFPVMDFNTEYKMGLNTAKYPPDKPIGGDTADTPDMLNFPGLNMGGL